MVSSYDVKDFRTTHFEYKDLTKTHGRPDIDSLITIFKELKRNAQKVPTILGGGRHGYLALVLKPAAYLAIPNAQAFVRPVHPGAFIPSNARLTQVEVIKEKAEHEEKIRQYTECNGVEDSLKNQLVQAIPSLYFDAIRDPDTDMIATDIPGMVQFLQKNYCKLTPEQVNFREDTLKNSIQDPEDPVDLVFNKILAFNNMCIISSRIKPDSQLVDYAYLIFNRCQVFSDHLISWNNKANADQTYTNMKTHMREAYLELEQVGRLSIKDSNINMLEQMTTHQERLTEELTTKLTATVQQNLMAALGNLENQENIPPQAHANAVQSDRALLTIIEQLSKKVEALGSKIADQTPNHQKSDLAINPKTGKPFKRYCYTCGCCNHWGRNHPGQKAPGHKDEATFKDRMGGSNKNCLGPKS